MGDESLSYSNDEFGTFTLAEDKLTWVNHDKKTGEITYADVQSVWLGGGATGGASGMGQASLVDDVGGTTTKTTSGTASPDLDSGPEAWQMKLSSDDEKITITMNSAMRDDAGSYKQFVTALHHNIASASSVVTFTDGNAFAVMGTIIISMVLLLLGGGAAFMGNATGLSLLVAIGGLLAVAALALMGWGVSNKKPKLYDPENIPADLLPQE